ncbi:MAG TPA: hypothetical protein VHW09_32860 [Bryobacteraceae bacterium]|jgi:hypothetical protein|nr:hypothetical protein [Bryobacteraceae bacterium]
MSCSFLIFTAVGPVRAISVATVGDSFADSLYNALRARPDLLQRYGVHLARWSRPIVGLARTDYFDYVASLRESATLPVDVCLVQIGSNDMQSIPSPQKQWIAYGSSPWREAYRDRTRELVKLLLDRRCGQLIWVLQPAFEKRSALACHRELIDEIQREAVGRDRTRILELSTSEADYGPDQTHFNRAYLLQLGPALFQAVDTSRQLVHMGCLACHRNLETLTMPPALLPLRTWRRELSADVWAPQRVGAQCRTPVVRRVVARVARRAAHSRAVR